jgi:hypothetical protein
MNDLEIYGNKELIESKDYGHMVNFIKENLSLMSQESQHFGKNQSQFMDNFLTVSHPTPLRNARQILAEITSKVGALKEAQYNHRKSLIQVKRLKTKIEKEKDSIELEEHQNDLAYELEKLEDGKLYVNGAIRALTNYISQYKAILSKHNITQMSEKDFEKEEEKYHIMKCFEQAICAARARGGVIDEGNHIYLSQIGVNGALAQHYVDLFFTEESEIIKNGLGIDGSYLPSFLEHVAKTFAGCSKKMADIKGIELETKIAILKAQE